MSPRLVVLLTAAAGVLGAPAAAVAATTGELARAAERLGPRSGVLVTDAATGRTVLSRRASTRRSLGSTTKLFTAVAALDRLGPPVTEVLASGPLGGDGTLAGDLVLRGGGDPTFGSSRFIATAFGGTGTSADALAAQVHAAGVRTVTGAVVGDESAFDTLRGPNGPAITGELEPLTALSYNRSRASEAGPPQDDPARGAAQRFDDALEARGIVIRGVARTGAAPPGAQPVTAIGGPSSAALAGLALKPSDDFIAEMLVKRLGRTATAPGTTRGGAAVAARVARDLGANVTLRDGSGLDPADRGSPRDVVALLRAARRAPRLRALLAALPRPGEGTLARRLTRGAARTRCRAKTGTLPARRLSALAGTCRANGRTLLFSIVSEGRPVASAQARADALVRLIARHRR